MPIIVQVKRKNVAHITSGKNPNKLFGSTSVPGYFLSHLPFAEMLTRLRFLTKQTEADGFVITLSWGVV